MAKSGEIRIVLSTPGFPASKDDPDKPFLLQHARALSEAGFQVTVVCPALPHLSGRDQLEGIEVIRVRYAPRRFETLASTGSMHSEARSWKALLVLPMMVALTIATNRELRDNNSIVYGHWWIPGGLVAVICAFLRKCRSVVHLHGSDAHICSNRLMRSLARFVLRRADCRLAVSQNLAKWGSDLCSSDVEVIAMPIPLDQFFGGPDVSEESFILAVGRLVHEKGFDVLIDAVAMSEENCRSEVVIVGDGPERQALLARAQHLGVKLRIPGSVTPTEIHEWYQRAKLVAVPSRREGFGLVAAEAAASSRAVVGTAVGGMPEFVTNGESGLLVKPDDARALADALERVDPNWGKNGPASVAGFSLEAHGRTLASLLAEPVQE